MFSPDQVSIFRFVTTDFDEGSGQATFTYAFDDKVTFVEEMVFPRPVGELSPDRREALDRALFLLSLVAGISYYKAAVPARARIESGPVTEAELSFLSTLYKHGLGEFAYENGVPLPEVNFEAEAISAAPANSARLSRRALVAVGGGKDSCVSIETLRHGNEPMFLRYIGHVLPSLGETGVTLSTIAGLVHDAPVSGADTPATAAVKGNALMAKVISRAIRNRQRPLRSDVEVTYGVHRLKLTAAESADVVATHKRRGGSHNVRRKRVEQSVAQVLYGKYGRAVDRIRALDPTARDVELEDFAASMREHPAVIEALDRMWPRLHPQELLHDLFGARPLIKLATKGILSADQADLLYRRRSKTLDDIPWSAGDIALLDEARILLGPLRPLPESEQLIPAFGHVVVDEAQDLSPMQLRMLGRRSLGGSMTMVGDIAQATGPWAPSSWQDVVAHLPKPWQVREVELTIGYRTPAEAMELAASVLAETNLGLVPPRPVRSSGEPPVIISTSQSQLAKEVAVCVQAQQSKPGTTGVIAPNALLDELTAAFDEIDLSYGTAGKRALDTNTTLLAADMAKGLEFDSVVVVEPAALVEESVHGLRSLYVALTRTTQTLSLVHANDLPSFLTIESAVSSEYGDD